MADGTRLTSEDLELWWMPEREARAWEMNSQVALKRLLALAGLWTLVHALAEVGVSFAFRRRRLSDSDSIAAARGVMIILHAILAIAGGLWVLFVLGEGAPLKQKHRVFAYSSEHDMVSSVGASFWVYSAFYALSRASTLGWNAVMLILMRSGVSVGLYTVFWRFPCVMLAVSWQWWNLGEAVPALMAVNRLLRFGGAQPKWIMGTFFLILGAALVRVCGYAGLTVWGYRWMTEEDIWSIPEGLEVADVASSYVVAQIVGGAGMTYLSTLEWADMVNATRDWSTEFMNRKRAADAAARARRRAGGPGGKAGGELAKIEEVEGENEGEQGGRGEGETGESGRPKKE